MNKLFFLSPLILLVGIHSDSSVGTVGTFSNLRYTEEHVYGLQVELWEYQDSLFGILFYYEGYSSDAPRGLIQEVVYHQKTRHLSFSVKLSMGLHYCKVHNNVPSRDVAHFEGTLYADSVVGTLTLVDSLDTIIVSSEKVSLSKSIELSKEQAEWAFHDIADWRKRYWDEGHKWLGPKW